jgi:hypothetical protein
VRKLLQGKENFTSTGIKIANRYLFHSLVTGTELTVVTRSLASPSSRSRSVGRAGFALHSNDNNVLKKVKKAASFSEAAFVNL